MSDLKAKQDLPWFVAQLRPQGLKRATDHLHRQKFETFAPRFVSKIKRAGVVRQVQSPLFPGYIFVSFDHASEGWAAINSTRGVSRLLIDRPLAPTPIPRAIIAAIMARCDVDGLVLPPEELKAGDRVRVLAGPFADIVATIETLPGPARIGVLIDLMGRQVKTLLSEDLVEKVK